MLHCINETFKHVTLNFTFSHCNAFEWCLYCPWCIDVLAFLL